jgi:hypothetical protein
LVILFSAALIALPAEVSSFDQSRRSSLTVCSQPEVLAVDINVLLNTLLEWYFSTNHNQTQKSAVQHILASLVNKRAPGKLKPVAAEFIVLTDRTPALDVGSFLEQVEDEVWNKRVAKAELSTTERTDAIEAWIWVSTQELINIPSC